MPSHIWVQKETWFLANFGKFPRERLWPRPIRMHEHDTACTLQTDVADSVTKVATKISKSSCFFVHCAVYCKFIIKIFIWRSMPRSAAWNGIKIRRNRVLIFFKIRANSAWQNGDKNFSSSRTLLKKYRNIKSGYVYNKYVDSTI